MSNAERLFADKDSKYKLDVNIGYGTGDTTNMPACNDPRNVHNSL